MSDLENPFGDIGILITFKKPDDFRIIRETLTRIGIASKNEKKLCQSCHILHKKGKYAILHFKELFKLDGKSTDITESDIARRNTIANILAEWGLLELINPEKSKEPVCTLSQIKIISSEDKKNWILDAKYSIGKTKRYN